VVIQPLSTRLIKPNFCFDLSHRRSTTVSLETKNSNKLTDYQQAVKYISTWNKDRSKKHGSKIKNTRMAHCTYR